MKAALVILLCAVLLGCSDNRPGRYVPAGSGPGVILDTQTGRMLAYHYQAGVGSWSVVAPPVDK